MRNFFRSLTTCLVIVCILTLPLAAIAADKKGEKNFKKGLEFETAQQWDKAAEEFALALAAKPGNPEFRLHYQRALFNASQQMMQRGRTLSEQKDYVGAYNAFRQAYGYDPVNELAKSEMDRMLRLQQGLNPQGAPQNEDQPKDGTNAPPKSPDVKLVPTAYRTTNGSAPTAAPQDAPQVEQLRDIKYTKVDLKTVIKDLAAALELNVLFDEETFRPQRDLTIELKNVTSAQALDYIFLQTSLFFQKVGKRTILIASQNRRQNFQQLVLRTFYLANAKPADVQKVLQVAIPPQPGRPPTTAIVDEATNSLTVRDTSENLKLIGSLIKSLDKDRAEVVMDVNIFEVSKDDLLTLGNQIGSSTDIINLGGTSSGVLGLGANGDILARGAGAFNRAIGTALLLPAAQIQAFQSKKNTRLLASTQVHAFNGEESHTRIGQRVPVQTAQLLGYNNNGGTGGINNNNNQAASIINYEQVGLTLKFTPQVFPNQDVQVKMSIESKDVLNRTLTPTFTERTISGTARIQNNRTLLLASVAQDSESNGRAGLPFLGLIPILGRLFTAPSKSNNKVDIVIAVTPHVLRAPNILPEDENERETGSIAVPTNSSLADMLRREDSEENFANQRRIPNTATYQLPDQEPETNAPVYVQSKETDAKPNAPVVVPTSQTPDKQPETIPNPIDSSIRTLRVVPTSDAAEKKAEPVPIDAGQTATPKP